MEKNILRTKSFNFSVRILKMTRTLKNRKVESVLSNQLLRSGTSISANVEEASAAISRSEFSMKLSISFKEARETSYWLRLLHETGTISAGEFNSIHNDLEEILKILWTIIQKTRITPNKK